MRSGMFKLIVDIATLDVGKMIDTAFSILQKLPEQMRGMVKMPSLLNAAALKAMPEDVLIEMLSKAINTEQTRMLPMLENALGSFLGGIQLEKLKLSPKPEQGLALRADVLVRSVDTDRLGEIACARFLTEDNAAEAFGGLYTPPFDKQALIGTLLALPEDKKLFTCLKLLSINKAALILWLEMSAEERGFPMELANVRFLLPK